MNQTRQFVSRIPSISVSRVFVQKYSTFPIDIMEHNLNIALIGVEGIMNVMRSKQLLLESGVLEKVNSWH
jgi:hypothetical protein